MKMKQPSEKVGRKLKGSARRRQASNAPARAEASEKHWLKLFGPALFTRLQKAARRDGMDVEAEVAHAMMCADRYAMMALAREYGRSTGTLAALADNWLRPSREDRRIALARQGYRLEADGWQTPEAAGIPEPEKGTA